VLGVEGDDGGDQVQIENRDVPHLTTVRRLCSPGVGLEELISAPRSMVATRVRPKQTWVKLCAKCARQVAM